MVMNDSVNTKIIERETEMTSEGTPEVDRDVRVDEAWKANLKRTYDEYQNEGLRGIRLLDAQINDLHTIRVQMLSDLATNSNLITKQCIRHNDIAIDCTWDPGPGEESLKDKG